MWWTPTASIGHHEFPITEQMADKSRQSGGGNLIEQMAQRMWPTPRAEGYDAGNHPNSVDSLPAAVKMWPTPTTQDAKNNGGPAQMVRNTLPLNAAIQAEPGMKLSAAWVTRMMGYPDGWLDIPR